MRRLMSLSAVLALLLAVTIGAAGPAPVADAAMSKDRDAVKTLLKTILIAPFALLVLSFALANRSAITISLDPLALYAALRPASGARYGAYLDTGAQQILSLSPELFFEISGGTITATAADAQRLLTEGSISRRGVQLRAPMPRFRMTPQDAADVTAFLRSLR